VCPFLGDDPTAPSVPMVVPAGITAQVATAPLRCSGAVAFRVLKDVTLVREDGAWFERV